jgi:hypothetical protein
MDYSTEASALTVTHISVATKWRKHLAHGVSRGKKPGTSR